MTSSIRKFWQRLENNVHPDDKPFFIDNKHTFNLDFPPPAFVGDVDNAPLVLLYANGGYCPQKTPAEFPHKRARMHYIDWLKGERKEFPKYFSGYYTPKLLSWLQDGTAVAVNAIAYRSPRISKERENKNLGIILPSYKAHKEWFTDELLPAVKQKQRFVIVHRPGLWCLNRKDMPNVNFVYSPNPVSPYPANDVLCQASRWLYERRILVQNPSPSV